MRSKFIKQPYEEFTVHTDFSSNMASGENVVAQVVTATDANGADVTSTVTDQATIANDGATKVSIKVRAGSEAGSPYKLTFRCTTSSGHKWEHDIIMKVVET